MFKRKKRLWVMPHKFDALCHYNGEVSRGIVHTKEYDDRMWILQGEYNEWSKTQIEEENKRRG
jgi:hypothetical protein